jgi:TRAP-type C4-dicarboxylate transport system permease small subunit
MLLQIERFFISISTKINWGSAICLMGMVLLTTFDVVLRIFGSTIPGTYEIIGLLGAIVISFSLAYTSVEKGHIAVEFLVQKFSKRTGAIINLINSFISIFLWSIISYQSFIYANELRISGEVSMTIQMPTYPFVYGIGIGCFFLIPVLIFEGINAFKEIRE